MKLKKFFWKNLLSLWLVFILIFFLIFIFTSQRWRESEKRSQINELTELALAMTVETKSDGQLEEAQWQQVLATQARISRVRVTLIDPRGKVIFDTEKEAKEMESHRYRPEIEQALGGQIGWAIRYSDTLGEKMLYVAVPIKKDSTITGICRVSRYFDLAILPYKLLRKNLLIDLSLFILLALILSYFILKNIWRPLEDLAEALGQAREGKNELALRRSFVVNLNPLREPIIDLISKNQEQAALLEEDQELIQQLINSSQEGWLLLDRTGKIILANSVFRKMFPEAGEGQQFYWQALRCSELNQLFEQSQAAKKPVEGELEKDGRIFSCLATFLPLKQRYLIKFFDITETRGLAQIKKEFVANLAHELKTPLTAIKGFLEALEEENLCPEGKNYLAIIERNLDRLTRLVEDLARLSELEEKGLKMEKEPVDLVEIINSVAKAYQKPIREKGLYLKIEAETLPVIMADPIQMEQMAVNLIENAIRYTEKGGLTISLKEKDKGICLKFSDTGIGIPEEHLPRIFERFYVVDKSRSRKTGGTGLGLSIVKHIVLAHGGRIEVNSAPGVGTTFTVWLPLSRENSQRPDNKL